VRCRESTGLRDNKKNRKIVESKDKAIKYELKHGKFNYLHFFPNGSKARYFKKQASDILFSEWWDKWISEKSLRYNTAKGWNSSYKVHIGPHFGHYDLSEIDEHKILVFRKALKDNGLKASTINSKIIKPLCMSLYHAYLRGHIDTYPCQVIRRLDEDPVDIDSFSFEELKRFLTALKKKAPEYHEMVVIWSRTGLRPGELCALKWKHIDFFNKKIMVRETMISNGSMGPPKTIHSIRDVDLRPPVVKAVKRQWDRTGLMDRYVFMTHANRPFSDAFLRKKFRHILKLAGLRYRSPKQLRHTFATLHIAAGENISWVSKMLGHASVEVTLKRYNRFVPNLTREDGSAFEKIMDSDVRIGHNQVPVKSK
jgi:integrase